MLDKAFELELIAFTADSCSMAEAAGADRIELCANPLEGGTTPSPGMIIQARMNTVIDLYPIIRPRGGDFNYSDAEFDVMQKDVIFCKQQGCDGVVIGMLNVDGTVDEEKTQRLVQTAWPMGVTFHRAFDHVHDQFEGLEAVIRCGCERILTSGGMPTAAEGAQRIAQLIGQADGRIDIMPGSGIRSNNIISLAKATGAHVFHSSARMHYHSTAQKVNERLPMSENKHHGLDPGEAASLYQKLVEYFGNTELIP